eukprot:CAMPEP_0182591104 /NCGR_PEP_ID=MMETSP1324-20130603/73042_1 /TAXON_ID=236786 /ORGANISM="Florenciella sp., Strain RCC1587" /LENGTH=188 /DNA_ID=CAMNT_0024808371 /DNA_START=585 /DNA_END=1153 /DNA_ORIENTATION=-
MASMPLKTEMSSVAATGAEAHGKRLEAMSEMIPVSANRDAGAGPCVVTDVEHDDKVGAEVAEEKTNDAHDVHTISTLSMQRLVLAGHDAHSEESHPRQEAALQGAMNLQHLGRRPVEALAHLVTRTEAQAQPREEAREHDSADVHVGRQHHVGYGADAEVFRGAEEIDGGAEVVGAAGEQATTMRRVA